MKKIHKTKFKKIALTAKRQVLILLLILICFITRNTPILAEGTKSIAPSTEDAAALFVGAGNTGAAGGDYGLFGWKDSDSKLFFNVQNTCEKVYFGFSLPKTNRSYSNTNPITGGPGFTRDLIFRVLDPTGQPINNLACFGNTTINGEVWQTLAEADINLTNRAAADAGPSQLVAGGYDAFELDLSNCGLNLTGDYSVEFFTTNQFYNPNTPTAGFHLEYFDITVADCNNTGQTGRVWSNNWSLSIKADGDGAFDRAFNGAFFVCSEEGFITKIDFNSRTNNRAETGKNNDQQSGFRAGAFNVSFNTTGPKNTGDILTDRLSVPNSNSPNPQLPVFLNLPDESICPEQPIGELQQRKDFLTGCADNQCINFATTQKGQLDILLENLNGNGAFDEAEEVRIAYEITDDDFVDNPETEGFNYQICIPWDGRDALGNTWNIVDLKISGFFRQGVYHFPSYDAEFNDDGFLVETVRPALGFQEIYYDDTAITEDNNTGEPKDGSNGCPAPCHRWTGEWEDFDDKDLVYGNFNTINTWWFGNTVFKAFQVQQPTALALTCPPDINICAGEPIDPSATGQPALALLGSDCIKVNFSDTETVDTDCQNGQIIDRTWVAFVEGMEEQQVSCTQRIRIAPSVAPIFTSSPQDMTIACNEVPPDMSGIIATSACENSEVAVDFSESILSGDCPNTSVLRREWAATDDCGNRGTVVQLITISDTEGPVFQSSLPDLVLDCDAATPSAANLNVSDNCDPASAITITFTDQLSNEAGGCTGGTVINRTYTATDQCGNATTAMQRIIFTDNTPPVLENIPSNAVVDCSGIPAPSTTITATDNCDNSENISIQLTEMEVAGNCAGNRTIERIWTATDGCGNVATAQQLIFIEDNTPPTLFAVPANVTISCDAALPLPPNVTATDDCSEVTVTFAEQAMAGLCGGSFGLTRIWTAKDACGNVTTAQQAITIIDTTPPTFVDCGQTIKVTAAIDCQAANVPIVPPKATDNCGGTVT
ncbi:MAG: hypothetical protein AAGJ18_17175, partial [Bacteroidota bacterium]